eukprot:g10658.t1
MKFLLSGDVNGKFSVLQKRISKLNKSKHGPFDAVLCVGNFFNNANFQETAGVAPDVEKYITNELSGLEVPLYFIGGQDDFSGAFSPLIVNQEKKEICKNVTFLGSAGIHKVGSITVAYLSANASLKDVNSLIDQKDGGQADFLLTHTWALAVEDMVNLLNSPNNAGGSKVENILVQRLMASSFTTRYHIAGCKNRFLKFLPYRNGNVVTRFIGLGNVGESDKSRKWMHALTIEHLSSPTAIDTVDSVRPNPYILSKRDHSAVAVGAKRPPLLLPLGHPNNNRFTAADAMRLEQNQTSTFSRFGRKANDNRLNQSHQHRNKRRRHTHVASRQDCWFCLASPTCEKHLIVSVASEMYLCLPKGGISAGHLLIVPISHEESMAHASNTMIEETKKYKSALRAFYNSHNEKFISIERCVTTKGPQHHTYIEIIPVPASYAQSVETTFQSECQRCDLKFEMVKAGDDLSGYIPEDRQYIYVELCDGQRFIHRVLEERRSAGTVPLQFGRQIIAKALACPERTNWKSCIVPRDQETQLANGFKGVFRDFDFTLKV